MESRLSEEKNTIALGPVQIILGLVISIGVILGGTWGIVESLVDRKISEHTLSPHPVTVRKAEEISKRVVELDRDGTKALRTEVGQMQIKQAGFGSDIVWIKDQQLRQGRKLDKILDRLNE